MDDFLGIGHSFALFLQFHLDSIEHLICAHETGVRHNVNTSGFLQVSVYTCSHTFETVQLVIVTICLPQITIEIVQDIRKLVI